MSRLGLRKRLSRRSQQVKNVAVKHNIDESDVELDDEPVKRDKNMVAWFKQYEHTLPKVVLLLIGSLATIAFDIPPHYLETFNHTCCRNFV